MNCDHANIVLKWGIITGSEFGPTLWGCSRCDATSSERLPSKPPMSVEHNKCADPDCFQCKLLHISFGSGTSPTRNKGAEAESVDAREKRWQKDMPAYKRLRQQGLQPKTIDGAARLEAEAETRFEVESGQLLPGQAKNIEDAVNTIESATGKSVYEPNTTPVNL